MGRKRKMITTGVVPIGGPRLKSRREARRITSKFHQIQNEISEIQHQIQEDIHASNEEEVKIDQQKRIELLEKSMHDMGGRDRYQQASVVTTSHHSTSKWVVSVLNKLGVYPCGRNMPRLNTLEVGAINTQLQKYPGLSVRAIDINSQHPQIEEIDFFDLIPTASHDIIVCSMVINCVDTPARRGDMLIRLSAQLKVDGGILFLVLPTKCINNDFLSRKQFLRFLRAVNLVVPNSNEDMFSGYFPRAKTDRTLEEICSRETPKLSFFVLIHRPVSLSDDVCDTQHNANDEMKEIDEHKKYDWFLSARFAHIWRAIRETDSINTYNRNAKKNTHNKTSKKQSKKSRFNSSEFSIEMPCYVTNFLKNMKS